MCGKYTEIISVKKILMGGNINKDIDKTTNAPIH